MRYLGATEFKFDFKGHEFTAYFDESDSLIDIDIDTDTEYVTYIPNDEYKQAMKKAIEQYEAYLKEQEAEAKDWENTKWHLEKQFTQF